MNTLNRTNPVIIAAIKNSTVFMTISRYPPFPVLTPRTTVRTIIPNTSSIIAALTIACPMSDFIFPSSLSVATVMLTDVAVKIVPMNIA